MVPAVLVLLLGLVVVGVWGAVEALRVRTATQDAVTAGREVRAAAGDQDWDAAATAADRLVDAAGRARAAADSPPLQLASSLPVVGDDVTAVRVVTSAADDVAQDALVPLLDVVRSGPGLDALVVDGRVDVAALAALAPPAVDAAAVAAEAAAAVGAIDDEGLSEQVAGPVSDARVQLDAASAGLSAASDALRVAPAMLGADGPRDYLVVFQNLAESRPTGGIVGSWAHMTADDGRIELLETGVNDDLEDLSLDSAAIAPEDLAVYGPDLARVQNLNLSPDFPTAARMLSALWVQQGREAPDGVVSMDPVLLQAVLRATGPVNVPGGPSLTGRNAVQVLQSDVYTTLGGDTAQREAYLGAAVSAVFDRLVASTGSPEVLRATARPATHGHAQLWSADDATEAVLAGYRVGGALPAPDAATVGVFSTNADASKLDHWTTRSVRVEGCGPDPELVVDVRNDAPQSVPEYVASKGPGYVVLDPPTTHVLVLSVYVPPERGVGAVTVDGAPVGFSTAVEKGWSLVRLTVTVPRTTQSEVRVQLTGEAGAVTQVLTGPSTMDPEPDVPACG